MASLRSKTLLIEIAAHLVEGTLAAREHAQDALHAAHLLDGLHLLQHVVHGEAIAQHALGGGDLLGRGGLLGLLDDADDVAHAEDALGHALGVEHLERIGLLAHRDELDGFAGHLAHRERAAAAGVAVELGDDHAVEVGALGEGGDHVDDVLTGHGVDHHEDLVGLDRLLDVDGLLHHLLVDLQTARGVDDDHVAHGVDGLTDGRPGDVDRMGAVAAEHGHASTLAAQRGELVGGRRAIHVARGEQRVLALLLEHVGELDRRGGLTGALQAHEHDDVGDAAGEHELALGPAEQLGELVEHDLDDVLRRREGVHDLGGEAALLGARDEVLHHAVVDVRLEKGHADSRAWRR